MKRVIFLALGWALPIICSAGPISSGGGMVVLCEKSGSLEVQLLDYFEAHSIYGENKVAKASNDIVEDYTRLVSRAYGLQGYLGESPSTVINDNLESFFGIVEWVDSSDLPFLNDQGETVELPSGCTLKQLAIFYDGRNRVKLARDLWNLMDSMNQAALIHHEINYKYERRNGELDSTSTRSYVRQMLTAGSQQPVNLGSETAKMVCLSTGLASSGIGEIDFRFFVQDDGDNSYFQFTQFAGRPLLILTTAKISTKFNVKRTNDFSGNPFIVTPDNPSTHLVESASLISSHRNDWQVHLEYLGGKPITLQALKSGNPIGEKQTITCNPL